MLSSGGAQKIRICTVADLSELDRTAVQIGGDARPVGRTPVTEREAERSVTGSDRRLEPENKPARPAASLPVTGVSAGGRAVLPALREQVMPRFSSASAAPRTGAGPPSGLASAQTARPSAAACRAPSSDLGSTAA